MIHLDFHSEGSDSMIKELLIKTTDAMVNFEFVENWGISSSMNIFVQLSSDDRVGAVLTKELDLLQ